MSPYADLTLAGASMQTKRGADPLLSRELLQPRAADYLAGQDAALGLISPVFVDLSGLPPLLIQAGTHEVFSATFESAEVPPVAQLGSA